MISATADRKRRESTQAATTPTSRLARSALTSRQLLAGVNNGGAEESGNAAVSQLKADLSMLASPSAATTSKQGDEFAGELPPPPSSPALSFADMMDTLDEGNFTFRRSHAGPMSLKQQEKKENFDLKLRLDTLQERLAKVAPGNAEAAVAENGELKVVNEALKAEIKAYKQMVEEANMTAEQARFMAKASASSTNSYQPDNHRACDRASDAEMQGLRAELEHVRAQLGKSQSIAQRYESQLNLYDEESRQTAQRMRQLELEVAGAQKRYAEAQGTIAGLREEVASLEEGVARKSEAIRRFTHDMHSSSADVEMVARQVQTLQSTLKAMEEERDALIRERDAVRKSLEKTEAQARLGGSSPRKSLDLLESKLLKELGQTTKKITDLERQTTLTQSEKDSIQTYSRKLGVENALAIATLQKLVSKIRESAELPPPAESASVENPSLTQAIEEAERACKTVLEELDDNRMQRKVAEAHLSKLKRESTVLSRENEGLRESVEAAHVQLEKAQAEVVSKTNELRSMQEAIRTMQARVKQATEDEIPRLQDEVQRLQDKLRSSQSTHEAMEGELAKVYEEKDEAAQRCEQLQSMLAKSTAELTDRKATISNLHQAREELLTRLAEAEESLHGMQKRVEDAEKAVRVVERVKATLEEKFNQDMKALHASNSELRMQLGSFSSGKTDLAARVERMQGSLNDAEKRNDELLERLQAKEQALSTIKREHDILLIDYSSVEGELKERQEAVKRLEGDLLRARRDDLAVRKTGEGVDLLQTRVDSQNKVIAYMKEQLTDKERTIRQMEDKLATQEQEMRTAMAEVDAQSRKLKKREGLIGQALKRLEQINYMRGLSSPVGSAAISNENVAPVDHVPETPVNPKLRRAEEEF